MLAVYVGFGLQELLILIVLGTLVLLPIGLVVGLVLMLKRRAPTPPRLSHCPHCGKPLA